jgi:DNA-binding transcriptional regulator GbsR (MarR family)
VSDTTENRQPLPAAIERFILQWGDMGSEWGVNRSVAQIHALLYLSERPLTADEIAATLGLARSNVSNSIKELLAWKLIRRVPVLGDRRDHFEAETDLWELVRRIVQGRKEREIDPAAAALRDSVAQAHADKRVSPLAVERLEAMLELLETLNRWYEQMLAVPSSRLMKFLRMGAKVVDIATLGRKTRRRRSVSGDGD